MPQKLCYRCRKPVETVGSIFMVTTSPSMALVACAPCTAASRPTAGEETRGIARGRLDPRSYTLGQQEFRAFMQNAQPWLPRWAAN